MSMLMDIYRDRGVNPLAVQLGRPGPLKTYPLLFNDPALECYWPLDGNSRDLKGGCHGVDTNVIYSTANGVFGQQGVRFRGSAYTSYIDLGNLAPLNIVASWTISAWMKLPASSQWERILMAVYYNDIPQNTTVAGYGLQISNSGQLAAEAHNREGSSAYYWEHGTTVLDDGIVRFVTATFSPTNGVRLYVNGVKETQIRSGSVPPRIQISPNSAKLGVCIENGVWYYSSDGMCLCDVALFERELSASEIADYYGWATAGGL